MKKKSKEIALAGMLSALAVVILFLGSMIELLDQLRDASDKLMEAELRGKAAMKAEDEEDEEDADR